MAQQNLIYVLFLWLITSINPTNNIVHYIAVYLFAEIVIKEFEWTPPLRTVFLLSTLYMGLMICEQVMQIAVFIVGLNFDIVGCWAIKLNKKLILLTCKEIWSSIYLYTFISHILIFWHFCIVKFKVFGSSFNKL